MFKKPNRATTNRILDGVHKTVVSCLAGITLISTGYLVYRGFKFYTDDKPLIVRSIKKDLLEEGAHDRDKAKELTT